MYQGAHIGKPIGETKCAPIHKEDACVLQQACRYAGSVDRSKEKCKTMQNRRTARVRHKSRSRARAGCGSWVPWMISPPCPASA